MKKAYIILLITLIAAPTAAQQKMSDLAGTWKIIVVVSGFKAPPPPDFMLLSSDSVCTWGVDSNAQPLPTTGTIPPVRKGRWLLNEDGDIELIQADTAMENQYYRPQSEGMYRYYASGKGTKKVPFIMLEMDQFIQKCK